MFLGQRLNFYVALTLLIGAVVAFVRTQRREQAGDEDAGGGLPRSPGGRAKPARSKG